MNNEIYPCLWFDGKAKEAAEFYCSIFKNAKITTDTPLVVNFEIEGKKFMGLNGGPMFKINPSISMFVNCQTHDEIDRLWQELSEGGMAMMPLDKYPWSEKYGWLSDKFGMTWQLMAGEIPPGGQKITTSFLFTGEQFGRGEEAMNFYASVFPNSTIVSKELYAEGEPAPAGTLKFGNCILMNENFIFMDGPGEHKFRFNEGLSIVVECDTQAQIDNYWNKLTEEGKESMCGWLVDKFGVSWQIIPKVIGSLMTDTERSPRVMQAVLKMKKLDIDTLVNA
jgi:predicted 3-demethylubiquinone-9 3-methyltransferase (glyoxalase superfamily)